MPENWMFMNGSTNLVKDVSKLNLPVEITEHAQRLIDQAEHPVVFWPNANMGRNTGAVHRGNPYQFWITIIPGLTKCETSRLVLSLLNYNIQHAKRYIAVLPKKSYSDSIQYELIRVNFLNALVGTFNSFCMGLESELYLQRYDISTSPEVKQFKTDYTKRSLLEYIEKQKQCPIFHWYRENEASNLIEYAACSRYSPETARWFKETVLLTLPSEHAQHYQDVLYSIESMIENVHHDYDGTNGEEIINGAKRQLIDILNLDSMLELKALDAFKSTKSIDGQRKNIYTYVPVDIEHYSLVLKGVRAANECLGLLVEANSLYQGIPFAKVVCSPDNGMNMSAFDDYEGNHYILIYTDFLLMLERAVDTYLGGSEYKQIEGRRGRDYVRERLFRYALFYATLHEYGHIVNGDCKTLSNDELLDQREAKADEFANQNISPVLMLQYRPNNSASFLFHHNEDMTLIREAVGIIRQLRKQCGKDNNGGSTSA